MMNHSILDAREERAALQDALRQSYHMPLLTLRVNTPGAEKNLPMAHGIFEAVDDELSKRLDGAVLYETALNSAEGPVKIRVVSISAHELKALTVSVEEMHPLGRFVDLDVYEADGTGLSRQELGFGPRSCYVCSSPAHECARSRRHGLEELLNVMNMAYAAFAEQNRSGKI